MMLNLFVTLLTMLPQAEPPYANYSEFSRSPVAQDDKKYAQATEILTVHVVAWGATRNFHEFYQIWAKSYFQKSAWWQNVRIHISELHDVLRIDFG